MGFVSITKPEGSVNSLMVLSLTCGQYLLFEIAKKKGIDYARKQWLLVKLFSKARRKRLC